jgi:hypothetical protein
MRGEAVELGVEQGRRGGDSGSGLAYMKTSSKLAALIALACATMVSAQAQTSAPTQDDAIFVNPEWANSAWYRCSIARSRGDIDQQRVAGNLLAPARLQHLHQR